MRGVKGPGAPPRGRALRPSGRAGAQLKARSWAKGRSPSRGPAPKTPSNPAHPSREAADLVDSEEEERVAFNRKHAADLEEESRRHISGETHSERVRKEEEEKLRRKVKGFSFDERRKKRGRQSFDEDDDAESSHEAEAEARARDLVGSDDGRGALFEAAPVDRLGDLSLADPNEMQRILGPSVRFAQHAMILAEQRRAEGASRAEAIAYLARLYARLDDRNYAEKALRMFGPSTGIIDLYPLEVIDHLLEHVPSFVQRSRRKPLFGGRIRVRARPSAAILLSYDPELRIRGFALRGGPRPGYRFEPVEPSGHYRLTLDTEGRFEAMVSAISRDGWLCVDTFEVEIDVEAPEDAEIHVDAAHPAEEPSPTAEPEPRSRPTLPNDLSKLSFPRRI